MSCLDSGDVVRIGPQKVKSMRENSLETEEDEVGLTKK